MRFLVDAQLPPALARWLTEQGHPAVHVFGLDLHKASDATIWRKAAELNAAVLTRHDDFATLVTLQPEDAPAVWLRTGNATTQALRSWLAPLLPEIVAALGQKERLIELVKGDGH